MSIVLSTATVPAEDRLDYWYEVIGQTYGQLASVRLDISTPTEAPFAGTITADELGPLRVATTVSDPVQVRQKTRGIDGRHDDYLDVCVQESGQLVIDQDDGQTLLRAGSLTLFDTTRPYTSTLPARHCMHVFQVPRSMVGFREAELHRITAVPLGADSPVAALAVPFFSRLAAMTDVPPPHIGDMLARNAADLLATLLAERLDRTPPDPGTGADPARTALRLRVKTFIDRHLADPGLSPQTVAAAHHISVRHLHRLFRDEGTGGAEGITVSRWILERRLERCRRELGRPGRSAPSVTAVAHRFGFTSPSHFSRAFRAAYGVSPREWRAGARRS
ncbi:helix-turn-helix domain-containing protein [Streptomyces telluris]|uniref:Helix-turn-helix domain-containing protein n=1 Tax=Streptomyces telluris TaxID=2720021 RepID=A0A9X2LCP7_9ACTN|nr:helix-turn-helix domain-containing protein [Streptomyces telluris]MCQ8768562.1 helix-turn-helix domain-containing protein [Streptomyces telluris]NJP77180.1 helix-turn-helix domain-containing protein [Streptomyces telluris]